MTAFDPITLQSDALSVDLLRFGASLVGVRLAGSPRNLVLGFADPEDHARIPICAGGLAGPVANRIRGGAVEIDGTHWQMPQNEGETSLHSGPEGTQRQHWDVEAQSESAVTLALALPHGLHGLPGNRNLRAIYALDGHRLRLTIEAETDQATPINLASHPYWSLDGKADVSGHTLEVAAQTYLPTDDRNLPLGQPAPVAGTPFDFTSSTSVPLIPELDLNFCLAETNRDSPQYAARLTGSDGTSLEIATTAPGLQVYNGSNLPADAALLHDGPTLAPYAGVALEPQHWPDAPHHPHFPQIILRVGEIYRQVTDYTLTPP